MVPLFVCLVDHCAAYIWFPSIRIFWYLKLVWR